MTRLAAITGVLVKERASLAEALDDAPLAADNLLGAYDPAHHTLDGRGDLNELSMGPASRGHRHRDDGRDPVPGAVLAARLAAAAAVPGHRPRYATPHATHATPGGH